jgi:hypothetical protein
MTCTRISWLVLAIVAPVWAIEGCGTPQPEKPVEPVFDYSKPVYTVDHAIVCPLGTLIASYVDVRADHGPEAIVALYASSVDRESREKALRCEEWRGGIKVEAVELEQRPEGLTLVQINGTLFTAKADLTNNPGR